MRIKIFCARLEKNYVQDLKKFCAEKFKIMYRIFLSCRTSFVKRAQKELKIPVFQDFLRIFVAENPIRNN